MTKNDMNVWDTKTGESLARAPGLSNASAVAFTHDNSAVLLSVASRVGVWDWRGGSEEIISYAGVPGSHGGAAAVAFSDDGKTVGAEEGGKVARVRDAVTGRVIAELRPEKRLNLVGFSPGGRLLAVADDDGTTRVRDWKAKRSVSVLRDTL